MLPNFTDSNITELKDDLYNSAPTAELIAKYLLEDKNWPNQKDNDRNTIAINGAWGSGKSTIVNFLIQYLISSRKQIFPPPITPWPWAGRGYLKLNKQFDHEYIVFSPWWYDSEEEILNAFFSQLSLIIHGYEAENTPAKALGEKLILSGLDIINTSLSAASGNVIPPHFLRNLIKATQTSSNEESSLYDTYLELANLLKLENRKILIIFDDLDRIHPVEFIRIIKLIKTVGNLPNVIYLLSLDKDRSAEIIENQLGLYDGQEYLEKIININIDIPSVNLTRNENKQYVLNFIKDIVGQKIFNTNEKSLENCFHRFLPQILTKPRDIKRLESNLRLKWPSVKEDVSPVDFFTLEAMNIAAPTVVRYIEKQKDYLTGQKVLEKNSYSDLDEYINKEILPSIHTSARKSWYVMLSALFPDAMNGTSIPSDSRVVYPKDLSISNPEHFDSYFKYFLDPEQISENEIDTFLENCTDHDFVKSKLVADSKIQLRDKNKNRAEIFLERLQSNIVHNPQRYSDSQAISLTRSLFSIAELLWLNSPTYSSKTVENTTYFRIREFIFQFRYYNLLSSIEIQNLHREAGIFWLIYSAESYNAVQPLAIELIQDELLINTPQEQYIFLLIQSLANFLKDKPQELKEFFTSWLGNEANPNNEVYVTFLYSYEENILELIKLVTKLPHKSSNKLIDYVDTLIFYSQFDKLRLEKIRDKLRII
ncbi:KAP family P-loop NTPase fold protein [Curvivirga sp.]|uniref:KAP family P-loop NTPase fold protein n=1 Tax=Curvivirga sp. TaxID=2856848 RepID=UPI003B5C1C7B